MNLLLFYRKIFDHFQCTSRSKTNAVDIMKMHPAFPQRKVVGHENKIHISQ